MQGGTVGLIGLGLMGNAIAKSLVAQGRRVVGFDLDPARVEAAGGIVAAESAAAVAVAADLILISVIDTYAVADAIAGPRGIVRAGRIDGKVVVDLSTTEIDTTKELAADLERNGAALVDAPVSGGPGATEAGRLAIMAGGTDGAIDKATPTLSLLGTVTHMGPTGTGQATKLVNQALVLTNFCVYAEAVRLAQAFGVDAKKVPAALASGFAGGNFLPVAFPRMVEDDFAPRGYARQVLKDLEMLHSAAKKHNVAMPMSAQALTLYRMLIAAGHSELDAGAIIKLWPKSDA